MANDLEEIKKAYGALITSYINLLSELTKTRSLFWGQKSITNLFIEAHVRANLIELANSLRYYNEIIKVQNNFQADAWIADRITDCNELSRTLTSWQFTKNLIFTLIPPAIGFVVAKLGLETIYQAINLTNSQIILLILFPYIGILLILLGISFIYKRSAFRKFEIYYKERTLFSLFDRKSKTEFPFDLIALGIGINLVLAATIYYPQLAGMTYKDNNIFNILILALEIVISLGIILELIQRLKEQTRL